MRNRSVPSRSRAIVTALTAVLGALVFTLGSASGVVAATMAVPAVPGIVAFADDQFNTTDCVSEIKSINIQGSGKKAVTGAKVSFEEKNACTGAQLTVVVVDRSGRQSNGVAALPVNAKDNVQVSFGSGSKAIANDHPRGYAIVS